jgi:hypothetical protein
MLCVEGEVVREREGRGKRKKERRGWDYQNVFFRGRHPGSQADEGVEDRYRAKGVHNYQ